MDREKIDASILKIISRELNVDVSYIKDIMLLKQGMTNRSFSFCYNNTKFIMRIPGEGVEVFINRKEEAAVYEVVSDKNLCEDVIFIDSKNGYKLTRFIDNARNCDSHNISDVKLCMKKLKELHDLKLIVKHSFDLFKQIEFYESLRDGKLSIYEDYAITKNMVFQLKDYIEDQTKEYALTHIDAVADNFLIYKNFNGVDEVRLIDWEYAAMQDPHVDIAMFCIYSFYDRNNIDTVIDIYFDYKCSECVRLKIYAYIAICGLLWSNWCEYKKSLGVEFGEYASQQYNYAKQYSVLVLNEISKGNIR